MPVTPLIDVDAVRTRLARHFGPGVAPWCEALPEAARDLAARWHLTLAPAWPNGGTSVVLPCASADGQHRVLKLTPDPAIAAEEATALTAWAASPHTVTLHDADPGRGALLLERILPGTRLADEPGRFPVEEVAPLLENLRRPAPDEDLPGLRDRADFLLDLTRQRLGRYPAAAARIPAGLIEASRHLARELAGGGPRELVHGDLHPANVLRAGSARSGQRLVAIDPRPCLGDPAFDAVDWALADGGDEPEVRQRIERLAARVTGLDPDRVWAWCRAMAVVIAAIALIARGDTAKGDRLLALAPNPR